MPSGASPTSPADQATVRRLNQALLMRSLVEGGPRSRARLAEDSGLNKATVSSIVTSLQGLGLVEEGESAHRGPGRPGKVVRLTTDSVRFLGLEVNVGYVAGIAVDLTGAVRARARVALPADTGATRGLAVVADLARRLVAESGATPAGVRSLHLSIPGLVDTATGVLDFAPNLGWRDVDVAHILRGRLGWWSAAIAVDNDANLGAMAEYAVGAGAGSPHLLYLSGEVGVGGGSVVDGRIARGSHGFAGEVGHMPIGPRDLRCGCGRFGCWETVVGLSMLLALVGHDSDDGPADLKTVVTGLRDRAAQGDPAVLSALEEQGRWLGIGLSVLANVLDPETIVLGGHFPLLAEYLTGPMHAELDGRLLAPRGRTPRILFSTLGFDAACLGGAHAGRELLIADPGGTREPSPSE